MVALLDDDRSGHLGLDEFSQLWRHIRKWGDVFRKHDTDGSHTISATELRAAFGESGLSLNRHVLQCLVLRYGKMAKSSDGRPERVLSFDDFVHCCIKLKFAIEIWNQHKKASDASGSGGQGGGLGSLFPGGAGNLLSTLGGLSGMSGMSGLGGMKYGAPGYGPSFPGFMSNGPMSSSRSGVSVGQPAASFSLDEWVERIMYS